MVRTPPRGFPSQTHAFVALSVLALACATSGCTVPRWATSRWAMDEPEYASKYERPYTEEGGDKIRRMGKQMIDARYIGGRDGWQLGAVYQGESPESAGASFERFRFSESGLVEGRLGIAAVGGTSVHEGFLGLDGGARLQSPSRLAPFVGVGGFAGVNWKDVAVVTTAAIIDGVTGQEDEDDTFGDALVETRRGKTHAFAAIYPEIGVHYWLNSRTRVTGSGSYWISTQGRAQDSWFLGINLSFLFGSKDLNQPPTWTPPLHTRGDPETGFAISAEQTNDLLGLGIFDVAERPHDVPAAMSDQSPWLDQRPISSSFDLDLSPLSSLPSVKERVQ